MKTLRKTLNANEKLNSNFLKHVNNLLIKKEEAYSTFYGCMDGWDAKPTKDVVVGDYVIYFRAVFIGSYKNACFAGYEYEYGRVIKDSYGKATAQHNFTIKNENGIFQRKGRVIHREACFTLNRPENHVHLAAEKHIRGGKAKVEVLRQRLAITYPSLNTEDRIRNHLSSINAAERILVSKK